MAIFTLFMLGIANFAMLKAVQQSGHPLLGQMPWFVHLLRGRFGLAVEFVVLLGAMMMVATGSTSWAWGYGAYSAINAVSAWLILTGRV